MRRTVAAIVVGLVASSCGETAAPRPTQQAPPATTGAPQAAAPAADEAVVRAWSDAINRNDNEAAADLFAPAAVVAQAEVFRLHTRRATVIWNESLPCGGDVVAVEMIRGALVATFVLRLRPDHECAAPGERAAAAFLIEGGKIRAWQQVPPPPADSSSVAA